VDSGSRIIDFGCFVCGQCLMWSIKLIGLQEEYPDKLTIFVYIVVSAIDIFLLYYYSNNQYVLHSETIYLA